MFILGENVKFALNGNMKVFLIAWRYWRRFQCIVRVTTLTNAVRKIRLNTLNSPISSKIYILWI